MSDLFCAATVIVARHGEAEYEVDVAGNHGGSLTHAGREQARALGESLRDRRIAAIWCSGRSRAVQTAEIAAGVLGLPVRVRERLHEFDVGALAGRPMASHPYDPVLQAWAAGDLGTGPPGGETGVDVVRRMSDELTWVADQFRGETVLVISHGTAMALTLPRLASNVPAGFAADKGVIDCGTCELVVDADGWVLRTWNGRSLTA